MISFFEEDQGGNDIHLDYDDVFPTEEELQKIHEVVHAKHIKQHLTSEDAIEKPAPHILYKDCTPIYKYLSVRMDDNEPLYQLKFLFGYEENDVVRQDIIDKASEFLYQLVGLVGHKVGLKGFIAHYNITEEKLPSAIEVKP